VGGAIGDTIVVLAQIITFVLLIHALLPFAPIAPDHPLRVAIAAIAEPIVQPFRRILPPIGPFDFSIMIAMFAIQFGAQALRILLGGALR
jgi:YggT family protein